MSVSRHEGSSLGTKLARGFPKGLPRLGEVETSKADWVFGPWVADWMTRLSSFGWLVSDGSLWVGLWDWLVTGVLKWIGYSELHLRAGHFRS